MVFCPGNLEIHTEYSSTSHQYVRCNCRRDCHSLRAPQHALTYICIDSWRPDTLQLLGLSSFLFSFSSQLLRPQVFSQMPSQPGRVKRESAFVIPLPEWVFFGFCVHAPKRMRGTCYSSCPHLLVYSLPLLSFLLVHLGWWAALTLCRWPSLNSSVRDLLFRRNYAALGEFVARMPIIHCPDKAETGSGRRQ